MPLRAEAVMGTLVTIDVVKGNSEATIDRAFEWFRHIESVCTRFDAKSELMRLNAQPGVAIPVSDILFEAVRFALLVAEETKGAFDPTIGHRMESLGFNREHRTGQIVNNPATPQHDVSYRDIHLDPAQKTITLRRALTLDLGAVAKGLAIDMAAKELEACKDFAIDAGGDLYLGGAGPQGAPWAVGIRHPRLEGELFETLNVSNQAVCTSGDYEKQTSASHHILDPRTGTSVQSVASVTVVASGAMVADALATAAFVLGPVEGLDLLNRMGVDGLILTPELKRYETGGLRRAA